MGDRRNLTDPVYACKQFRDQQLAACHAQKHSPPAALLAPGGELRAGVTVQGTAKVLESVPVRPPTSVTVSTAVRLPACLILNGDLHPGAQQTAARTIPPIADDAVVVGRGAAR